MKKTFCAIVCLAALSTTSLWTAETKEVVAPSLPAFETAELEVLKVFSAKEGDAIFRAYLVSWKGQEVVASYTFARAHYQVGDIANVLVLRSCFRNGDGKDGLIQFQMAGEKSSRFPNTQLSAHLTKVAAQPSPAEVLK